MRRRSEPAQQQFLACPCDRGKPTAVLYLVTETIITLKLTRIVYGRNSHCHRRPDAARIGNNDRQTISILIN
jgi:hypothetical protein